MQRAVVLLSGGLDSATVAAIALGEGYEVTGLSFDYGQRHRVELEAAAKVAEGLGISDHRIVPLDLRAVGGSALTDEIPVPKDQQPGGTGIPVTYVPARNTIFLSYALGLAEVLDARDLFIGVNAVDFSGYPDCRPAFVDAFENLANLATKAGVEGGRPIRVHAPLMKMSKAEIIEKGIALGVDYSLTVSCYDPEPKPCGHCEACQLRQQGFAAAGVSDPALVRP